MRRIILMVALVAGGCASVSKGGGSYGGAAVTSGETKPQASETGANTNSPATNGSDTSIDQR
jgi:uncharacterized protein YceK